MLFLAVFCSFSRSLLLFNETHVVSEGTVAISFQRNCGRLHNMTCMYWSAFSVSSG